MDHEGIAFQRNYAYNGHYRLHLHSICNIYTVFKSINRFSGPAQIFLDIGFVGAGVMFMLLGMTLLFPGKINKIVILSTGSMLSASGILGFILLYPDNWFYPEVAYVMVAHALGTLLLLSNMIFQESGNNPVPTQCEPETENIDRENTMFSGESQLTAALSSMMISQIINPTNEFQSGALQVLKKRYIWAMLRS
jgi:hypothetical protein